MREVWLQICDIQTGPIGQATSRSRRIYTGARTPRIGMPARVISRGICAKAGLTLRSVRSLALHQHSRQGTFVAWLSAGRSYLPLCGPALLIGEREVAFKRVPCMDSGCVVLACSREVVSHV
jgi:hypothetical protein